jgi:succinoglycan biosynthesis transport protein ExoP
MTFDQFLRIVRARWILALSIFLTIVIVTIVATLIWPKSYTATASVMVDMRPDPVSIVGNMAGVTATSYVATQVDIIGSPRVAQQVVRLTGLGNSNEMRERWQQEAEGKGDFTAWLANVLGKKLDIEPSRESNVIAISYEGSEPQFAAAMANAFARAYIESTTQLRVDPARQYSDFFEERARIARDKLERVQEKLAEAQKDKDILATDERLDIESLRLSELSQQVLALKALRVESANRSKHTRARPDQSSDVLNSNVIASLKSQQTAQEAALSQLSERLGDRHPQVIEVKANIQTLQNRINLETRRVTSSIDTLDTVNGSREGAAVSAYDEQRAKVMRLKDERSKLSVIEREVESAQRVYEAIQLRLSQTSMESSNSQSGVVLLNAATEPATPSSPRLFLNLGLSIAMGILLALIAVLGIELMDRRVRSGFDIMDTVELPVLGLLPGPNASRTKRLGMFKRTPRPLANGFSALTSTVKRADTV